jgi:hypothetical protein
MPVEAGFIGIINNTKTFDKLKMLISERGVYTWKHPAPSLNHLSKPMRLRLPPCIPGGFGLPSYCSVLRVGRLGDGHDPGIVEFWDKISLCLKPKPI